MVSDLIVPLRWCKAVMPADFSSAKTHCPPLEGPETGGGSVVRLSPSSSGQSAAHVKR